MQQITMPSGPAISRIGFAEKPLRADPAQHPGDFTLFSLEERAAIIEEALASGINFFLAAHERDALTLAESLDHLDCREQAVLAATDGDVLSRCPDSETDAANAIRTAIQRKLHLLKTGHLDFFLLYDYRSDVHTPARLAGARLALDEALTSGTIGAHGATCYRDFDALASSLADGRFTPDLVIARLNAYDQEAAKSLLPTCAANSVAVYAAQPFAWVGGVPYPRFPNAWRLRNMTMNFFGQTVGQAHLRWLLAQPGIAGIMVSMNEPGQPKENASAFKGETLPPPPNAVESLFQSFREAILETDAGWTGLLQDPLWEIRHAAADYLAARR